jgi:hypothetical protein
VPLMMSWTQPVQCRGGGGGGGGGEEEELCNK